MEEQRSYHDIVSRILGVLDPFNMDTWAEIATLSRPLAALGYLTPQEVGGNEAQADDWAGKTYQLIPITTDIDNDLALLCAGDVAGEKGWQEGIALADSLYADVYSINLCRDPDNTRAKILVAAYEVLLRQLTPHGRSLAMVLLAGSPETEKRPPAILRVLGMVLESGPLGGPLAQLAEEKLIATTKACADSVLDTTESSLPIVHGSPKAQRKAVSSD